MMFVHCSAVQDCGFRCWIEGEQIGFGIGES
jgi:cold shock CspA family protein